MSASRRRAGLLLLCIVAIVSCRSRDRGVDISMFAEDPRAYRETKRAEEKRARDRIARSGWCTVTNDQGLYVQVSTYRDGRKLRDVGINSNGIVFAVLEFNVAGEMTNLWSNDSEWPETDPAVFR